MQGKTDDAGSVYPAFFMWPVIQYMEFAFLTFLSYGPKMFGRSKSTGLKNAVK